MRRTIALILIVVSFSSELLAWMPGRQTSATWMPQGWPAGVAPRALNLIVPDGLRIGEEGVVTLEIIEPSTAGDETTGDGQTLTLSARLEIPGLIPENSEQGAVLTARGGAHFQWALRPAEAGAYPGRLWVYTGAEQTPLLVRPIEVRVGETRQAWVWVWRTAGAIGAIIGTFIFFLPRRSMIKLIRS